MESKEEREALIDSINLDRLLKIIKHLDSSRKVTYVLNLELDNKEPPAATN